MLQRFKHALIALLVLGTGVVALIPALASAASFSSDACSGVSMVNGGSGSTCDSSAGTKISKILKLVINTLSVIVGIAAVIMVIVSGFKYITSNGDSNSVSSAKSTLIYAVIGLMIVVAAQVIVHFVISKTAKVV